MPAGGVGGNGYYTDDPGLMGSIAGSAPNFSTSTGTGAGVGTSPWSSILGNGGLLSGLGSVAGNVVAGQGYGGAQSAYDQALQQMITQQGSVYNQVAGLYNPARTAGNNAIGSLSGALGLGGKAPDYSQFTNSPGYQFQLQQGTNNINRQASANGSLYTPNTMAALGQFSQGLAGTTYQNYINNLLSTAGLGAQATQGTANAGLTTGNNIAQGLIGTGAANASGILGKAGANGNLLSGMLGTNGQSGLLQNGYNAYNQLSNLFGGGSGVSAADWGSAYSGLDASTSAATDAFSSGLADELGFSSAGGQAAGAGLGAAGAGGLGSGLGIGAADWGGAYAGLDASTAAMAGTDAASIAAGTGAGGAASGAGGAALGAGAGATLAVAAPLALMAYAMSTPPYTLNQDYYNRMQSSTGTQSGLEEEMNQAMVNPGVITPEAWQIINKNAQSMGINIPGGINASNAAQVYKLLMSQPQTGQVYHGGKGGSPV